jgi:predicted acetyltransferase
VKGGRRKMKMYLKKLGLEEPIEIFNLYQEVLDDKWVPPLVMTKENFSEYLKKEYNKDLGIDSKDGEVRQTIYWLYVDDKPCGIIFVRQSLNEALINEGQIAYYIRKEERGKRYGNQMLALCLDIFRNKGDKKILITCNVSNKISRKIIENNMGVLENIVGKVRRYWIYL